MKKSAKIEKDLYSLNLQKIFWGIFVKLFENQRIKELLFFMFKNRQFSNNFMKIFPNFFLHSKLEYQGLFHNT